ncbi:hypothetical protein NESM_000081600 [Novymonas esmeraldas]|uniref:Uncharacterized protein n=1 Tax=Novymonas esmeraldas TaxID=1808958 RepID=A0AAW0F1M8_9TRYP
MLYARTSVARCACSTRYAGTTLRARRAAVAAPPHPLRSVAPQHPHRVSLRFQGSPGFTPFTTGGPDVMMPGPQHTGASYSGGSGDPRASESGEAREGDGFTELDLKNPPPMPSPQHYQSYDDYLDAYDQFLQDTAQFLPSARVFLQRRLRRLRRDLSGLGEAVRREYFWTFVPFICALSVHMIDAQHHANAQHTRERLKEHTKQHVKTVQWESV